MLIGAVRVVRRIRCGIGMRRLRMRLGLGVRRGFSLLMGLCLGLLLSVLRRLGGLRLLLMLLLGLMGGLRFLLVLVGLGFGCCMLLLGVLFRLLVRRGLSLFLVRPLFGLLLDVLSRGGLLLLLMLLGLLVRHLRLVLMLLGFGCGLGMLLLGLLLGLLLLRVLLRLLLSVLGRLRLLLLLVLGDLLLVLLLLHIGALLVEAGLGGDLVLVLLLRDGLLLGLLLLLLFAVLVLLVGIVGDQGAGDAGHDGGRGDVGAAMVADRRRWWPLVVMLLPVVESVGFLGAAILFTLPVGGLFGGVFVVVGAPLGLAALLGLPVGAGGVDLGAARGPVGGTDLAAFAVQRGCIDVAGARQFAGGAVGIAVLLIRRQGAAVAIVDDDQFATIVIAVRIIGVADQVGFIGAGLVIIVAVAAVDRFDQADRIVMAAPGPDVGRAIIVAIVGRGVAEGVAHGVGALDIGVVVLGPCHMHDAHGRRRGGQGAGGRRRGDRCFRTGGQRHGQRDIAAGRRGRRPWIGRGIAGGKHRGGGDQGYGGDG